MMDFEKFLKNRKYVCHCQSLCHSSKVVELEDLGVWASEEITEFMGHMDYNEWTDFDGEEMCEYGYLKDIAIACLSIKKRREFLKDIRLVK